ncbi:MAG: PilZ domain-containing protein [Polyangiales bacterium]
MALRQFGAKREARGAVRRLIDLDCGVYSEVWGEVIMHRVTDVSEEGLWIETDLLLEVGSEVTLTFYPPDWDEPLCVAGRVRRVEFETAVGSSSIGMGIAFETLRTDERRQLHQSMRCLRAEASYLLDQRTLVGVPVGNPGPASDLEAPANDPRDTVFGWGAPVGDAQGEDPTPLVSRRVPSRVSSESAVDPDLQAFGGGLDLASSVFGDDE